MIFVMKKHLKDFFIPHEGNQYKPHSLQKAAMMGMVVMVLLSFTLANVQSFLWIASDWMVSTVLPGVIVDLTNQERTGQSLGTLQRNAKLDAAAKMKAQHMAEKEYFAHFSPNGVSPWYWFSQANYNFVHAGENLAIHFTDSDEVVDAWMKSPTHRANIVNGSYTEIGVGTAEGSFEGYKTVYVVQLFGTPAASPAVAGNTTTVEPAQPIVISAEPEPVLPAPAVVAVATEPPVVTLPVTEQSSVEQTEVLSESVEITEDVTIVTADPLPILQETEIVKQEEVLDEALIAQEASSTEITSDQIAFSSFISTSTGAAPASIDPTQTNEINNTPYLLKIMTQPTVALQIMYSVIGLFVLMSLVLSIGIGLRRHHPMQIAYSMALLLLMFGLFKIHELLSVGAVII
jgi:hypothetical protein